MCGIVGALSSDPDKSLRIEEALKAIAHRGPDDQGTWRNPAIYLGHSRLSILDLSSLGHQPMSDPTGRFVITFNGEIYNYLELRQKLQALGHLFLTGTDTEVLLAAYAQWGKGCLGTLRGMFAFAIWDKHTETLFLARDRLGEKPLYYWHDGNTIYFASELKALVRLLPQIPKLDAASIDWYLHYQYVPEPHTPLTDVWKLPAAHHLTVHRQSWQIQLQCYWNLEEIPPVSGDPVLLIRQELERSIELTLRSDVPVGLALSGGIDSGAIAALAASRYKDTLQTFGIGYPGHPPYDERNKAKALANELGLPFYDIELTTEEFSDCFPDLVFMTDDPIADIAAYAHYSVMRKAAEKQVKVMLTGIGGDEVFWGYAWTIEAVMLTQRKQRISQKKLLPSVAWTGLTALTTHPFYHRVAYSKKVPELLTSPMKKIAEVCLLSLQQPHRAVYPELVPDFREALRHSSKLYTTQFAKTIPIHNSYLPFTFDLDVCQDIPLQICRLLYDTWLKSNCLSLGDRVSMASGVEVRLPLLDYRLIELVIGLRKAQPDHLLGQKYWFKAALQGILSEEVLNRPKQGFQPPTQEWMESVLRRYLSWLETGYLVQLEILNRCYLQTLIKSFLEYRSHLFMLYKLLLLETWYRKVVLQGYRV